MIISPHGRAPKPYEIKWAFGIYHGAGQVTVERWQGGLVVTEDGQEIPVTVERRANGAIVAKAPTEGKYVDPGRCVPVMVSVADKDGYANVVRLDVQTMATDDASIEERVEALLAYVYETRGWKP